MGKNANMKKFAFLSDLSFTFFTAGIFTLVLFRYRGVGLLPALLLALLCGGLTALAVGCVLEIRRKSAFLKKSDEAQKERLLLHLALLSEEAQTEYFISVLSTAEEPVKRFGKLRIFNQTEFFFLKFSLSPLSADEIPKLARLKTGKKKILLCGKIEEDALALCKRLDIEVKTGEWTYALLKEKNALPERFLGEEPAEQKTKRRRKTWFSKKNAKRFLIGGAMILLLSRLTPYSYYYLLLGTLLLFASVFIRIFGYE